jgi:serine/threonine protein kinase
MVFELCSGGDLFERVSGQGRYPENTAKVLIKRLVVALEFCHKKGILHRDLKMENVVLENAEDSTSAKLIDFGLARLTGVCVREREKEREREGGTKTKDTDKDKRPRVKTKTKDQD